MGICSMIKQQGVTKMLSLLDPSLFLFMQPSNKKKPKAL